MSTYGTSKLLRCSQILMSRLIHSYALFHCSLSFPGSLTSSQCPFCLYSLPMEGSNRISLMLQSPSGIASAPPYTIPDPLILRGGKSTSSMTCTHCRVHHSHRGRTVDSTTSLEAGPSLHSIVSASRPTSLKHAHVLDTCRRNLSALSSLSPTHLHRVKPPKRKQRPQAPL
jgi:hypothetical protein